MYCEDLALEDVDPHAHVEVVHGLLLEPAYPVLRVMLQDTEVDLRVPLVGGDGGERFLVPVVVEKRAVIDIREDIPVHHQERLLETVDEPEGSDGPRWFALVAVSDRDLQLLSPLKVGVDQPVQIPRADDQIVKPGLLEACRRITSRIG